MCKGDTILITISSALSFFSKMLTLFLKKTDSNVVMIVMTATVLSVVAKPPLSASWPVKKCYQGVIWVLTMSIPHFEE